MQKHAYILTAPLLALALTLTSCSTTNHTDQSAEQATTAADSGALVDRNGEGTGLAAAADGTEAAAGRAWDGLDWNLPNVQSPRIRMEKVSLRAAEDRASYDLPETVLFATDQATLSNDGAKALDEVAEDYKERFAQGGMLKVYGFADTTGSKAYNKDLSEKRAMTVKQYLVGKTGLSDAQIEIQAMGERNPTGRSNAADRRVVIAARKA